ncbi:RDD family protein [Rhodobacteraceae bacterium 2CG4]|uniref:RDD family protein n=1 Tax=Halovulum marinum TaxID=2662447 RepID=A0A6L5Z4P4_9RHOB|nr:RDD family protein [Halovulum marinum]MSU90984.1 RDD family protein [Halovulum marinum]
MDHFARMHPLHDLPHPEHDTQFYDGVPLKRLVAWLIDFTAIVLATVVATLAIGLLTLGLGFALFPAILFLVTFLYRWLTIAGSSATPGMMLMGIELRSCDGHRLTPVIAAVHTGIFMFLMASVVGWIGTAVSIWVTRYNQGLPDLLLGTTAINRPLN